MANRGARPATRPPMVTQAFGMSEALDAELVAAAHRLGLSKAEVIRRALRLWLDNSFSEERTGT